MKLPTAFQMLGAWLLTLDDGADVRTKAMRRLSSGRAPGLRWSGGSFLRGRRQRGEAYRMELTSTAEQFVQRIAAVLSAELGLRATSDLVTLTEMWVQHWNGVLGLPAAFEKFRHRVFRDEPPRQRAAPNWNWRKLWVPEVAGFMLLDLGLRLGAVAVLRSNREMPAWLTRPGRHRFPRPGSRQEVRDYLSRIEFDFAPSTIALLEKGARPGAATLRKFDAGIRLHFAAIAAIEVLEVKLPKQKVDALLKTLSAVAKVAAASISSAVEAERLLRAPPPAWVKEPEADRLLTAVARGRIALASRSAEQILETPYRHPWRRHEHMSWSFEKEGVLGHASFKPTHPWMPELIERLDAKRLRIWEDVVGPSSTSEPSR